MKKEKNCKGFSLIELIIAIAILVILTGLLAPQFMRYMEKSRESKDMQTLDTVYGAVQVALTNGDAYHEVLNAGERGGLSGIMTTGLSLNRLFLAQSKGENFLKEFYTTMGISDALAEKLADGREDVFSPWTSKAVTDAGGNGAIYILVDKDMKVTVWIGNITTGGVVTSANSLSPAGLAFEPSGTNEAKAQNIKTVGNTFFISK